MTTETHETTGAPSAAPLLPGSGEPLATAPMPGPWRHRHVLDLDDFGADEIETVIELAGQMAEVLERRIARVPALRGHTIVNLFYEPSTRTRASFELAGKVLGADVLSVSASTSSVQKGESLIDTVRTLRAMGAGILVMRHASAGAPYLAARHTDAAIVNAGDGAHAHPTQALLDLYTIRRHFGDLRGLRVVMVGDIAHSRVARSDLWGLSTMGAEVVVCGPPTLLPRGLRPGDRPEHAESALPYVEVETDIERAIEGAHVVMALRLQSERQQGGLLPSLHEYALHYQVTAKRLARAHPDPPADAPRPQERGHRDRPRGRRRRTLDDRGAGHERRRRAHGAALPAGAGPRHGGRERRGGHPVSTLAIHNGRVIDPALGRDGIADVVIVDGRVARIGPNEGDAVIEADRIDATGLVVTPGFVDLHVHLREPGFEYKETITSGTAAAARGGFTTVCAMPNTDPPLDRRSAVESVLRQAEEHAAVRVLPLGCITRERAGKELAPAGELAQAGVVALSDDGDAVADARLMRHALEYAGAFGLPISQHCEDPTLVHEGQMHEGWVATRLGLRGRPASAEETFVARDIALADLAGGAPAHRPRLRRRLGRADPRRTRARRAHHRRGDAAPPHPHP